MPDLFISYSRKDTGFVRRLNEALETRGRDPWVDWEGIPPSASWMAEINAAVEAADTFIFVISPDSVASDVCRQEIEHAVQHNKRLIPIVCSEPAVDAVPEAIAKLNWIFFREADAFDASVDLLLSAADTDLQWLQAHTRLLTRAVEWDRKSRDKNLLPRGRELAVAEELLAESGQKEPPLTQLQTRYIVAAGRQRSRRQWLFGATASAVAVVTLVLAAMAWWQAEVASSRELAAAALNQLDDDPERSVLLATAAAERAATTETEDALRRALFASRVRSVVRGHEGGVLAAEFSGDGTALATLSDDGQLRFSGVPKGQTIWTRASAVTQPRRAVVESAGENADRSQAVAAGVAAGQTPAPAREDANHASDSTYLADRHALVHELPDGGVLIEDLLRGTRRAVDAREVRRWGNWPRVLATSRDGRFAVTVDRSEWSFEAMIRNLDTQETVAKIQGYDDSMTWATFSPDGATIATTSAPVTMESGGGPGSLGEKTARLWSSADGTPAAVMRGHTRDINTVAFSPDGDLLLTTSGDRTARVWDASSGRALAVLRGHADDVVDGTFSADGRRVATASADTTARIWDTLQRETVVPALPAGSSSIQYAAFDPGGGQVAIVDYDDRGWIAATASGEIRASFGGDEDALRTASFSPDGQHLVTAGPRGVAVRDAHTGERLEFLEGFSTDGHLQVVASLDARKLALSTGDVRTVSGPSPVTVVDRDNAARSTFGGEDDLVYAVALDRQGRWLASAGEEGVLQLRDLTGKEASRTLPRRHSDLVLSLSFSPDGLHVVSTSRDATAIVWEVASGTVVSELRGHDLAVMAAAFNPDGHTLATLGEDNTIRVWQLSSGVELALIGGFAYQPITLGYGAEGRDLLVVTHDGLIRRYELGVTGGLDALRRLAAERVTRTLTDEERREFLHPILTLPY